MAKKTMTLQEWCINKKRTELLSEWDNERNSMLNVSKNYFEEKYNSCENVFWKCNNGHSWKEYIIARTIFNMKCPICYPEMSELPVGTKYGCITIVAGYDEYKRVVAEKIMRLEQEKIDFINGVVKPDLNIDNLDYFENEIQYYKTEKYKCKCKCGLIQYLSKKDFLEKKHRYCTEKEKHYLIDIGEEYFKMEECGLKTKHRQELYNSHKRGKAKNYDVNLSNTYHESLEILECINDSYEELSGYYDKRKKGGAFYTVYKIYRCRCYLCGKEQDIKCSEFCINPPSEYGKRAYDGYYSEAHCDCHKISSFQWIVNKILIKHNISYRVEVSFPNLYGVGHINLLSYDFSILNSDGSIKCLIECQGEQHYKPVEEFGGNAQFEIQQLNDKLKRNYAMEHNIPLYEISYKEKKYENVEAFLRQNKII
ncbi:MAG: zinc-ribbon domain-containing protein [Lachnospiraceae bacterium]|nr:zinc-ribbon domain-containing protein [Lachnospiraceae bacterium]